MSEINLGSAYTSLRIFGRFSYCFMRKIGYVLHSFELGVTIFIALKRCKLILFLTLLLFDVAYYGKYNEIEFRSLIEQYD